MGIVKAGITGRRENALARQTAKEAIKLLQAKGIEVETDRAFLGTGKTLASIDCDITISFGGDGTLLQVFREQGKRTPVMGINCGSRGFLQAFGSGEIGKAVRAIAEGEYSVEKRTRILAKVDGRIVGEALNEVLIVPRKAGRLLKYRLRTGKDERHEAGDGLIVSTPTGSTAHALSAGGPIVRGNAAVFVVVSINPVDWEHRPLIINDHEKVALSEFGQIRAEAIIDGQKRFAVRKKVELEKGSEVLLATVR